MLGPNAPAAGPDSPSSTDGPLSSHSTYSTATSSILSHESTNGVSAKPDPDFDGLSTVQCNTIQSVAYDTIAYSTTQFSSFGSTMSSAEQTNGARRVSELPTNYSPAEALPASPQARARTHTQEYSNHLESAIALVLQVQTQMHTASTYLSIR